MWIFKSRVPGFYFDPYYKNLVQFKHACLNDYVLQLSEREKNAFSKILYLGYYDCDQANVISKAYIKSFLKAGVFEEIGGKYFYPKELRDNIFFTIYYFMYK